MHGFGEVEDWKTNKEIVRREVADVQLLTIQEKEEGGGDFGTVFSGGFGNGGDQCSNAEQQGAHNETLGNVELEGSG